MRKQYRPNAEAYKLHFRNQHEGAPLLGFKGVGIQRGYGLGSMFRSLFRSAIPFLKSGAKAVGKAALNTGMGVANDVIAGKDLKTATTSRLKQTGQKLKGQALEAAKGVIENAQSGRGRKRKAATTNGGTSRKARQAPAIKRGKTAKTVSRAPAKKGKASQGKKGATKRKAQQHSSVELGAIFRQPKTSRY